MILRRVIAHVREQNWTAIAIDFVIVVIGVFVGIQVSNWNEARVEERLGRAYTARLAADLERNAASGRALTEYFAAVLDSVERGDALLQDPNSSAKDLVVHLYRASEVIYNAPARATWDEIVSGGHLGLLAPEFASRSAEYFAFDIARSVLATMSESAYRQRVRALIPLSVQKALRAGCSDLRDDRDNVMGFMPDCTLALDDGVVEATARVLRGDAILHAELRNQYSHAFSAHVNLRGNVSTIELALATLGRSRPDGPGSTAAPR